MTEEAPVRTPSVEDVRRHNEQCEKEVDLCHKTINEEQSDYDKQLLTLASGFLGIVVAFVKDVVPLKVAVWPYLFYGSLVGFILCILTVLLSYQLSIEGHFMAKSFWENRKTGEDYSDYPFGIAKLIRCVNLFSGGLFFLAIILLAIFIIRNVAEERKMPEDAKPLKVMIVQEGAYMKTPPLTEISGKPIEKGAHMKVPPQTPPSQSQQAQQSTSGNSSSSSQASGK